MSRIGLCAIYRTNHVLNILFKVSNASITPDWSLPDIDSMKQTKNKSATSGGS